MPQKKRYPDELRQRAVQYVFQSGNPIAQCAAELGIHRESLRKWVRQEEADRGQGGGRLTSDEREELNTLRKEVLELRRANEILKSASAFFARELDRPRTR
jgi:transposase